MRDRRKPPVLLCVIGIIPVVWVALLIAPAFGGGLVGIVENLPAILENPFHLTWYENSLRTVLIVLCAYGLGIGMAFSMRKNKRPGEEHGSARWGDVKRINRKYAEPEFTANKLFTHNFRLGYDGHKHRRNLNTLVVGGSGAAKTRGFAKPNVMQCNTSMVILDPKGEIARDTGKLLKAKGYEVKVLDLINMNRSHCYNPFAYLQDDNDIQRLVTGLFAATTPQNAQSSDPFWDNSAQMLLMSLVFYLHYEAPQYEQNFSMVMEMLRAADMPDVGDGEGDGGYRSPLDELFDRLELRDPDHIALKYYQNYRANPSKTLKSIQGTLASRLEKFNLSSLSMLTMTDELDLERLGEKKTAIFCIIPDNDASFNFLISLLYTQLFQILFYVADHKYGGALPVPVHIIADEFANISQPKDFPKILSVCRSRMVSISIILQNIAQIKALFEKEWESIVGNCDTFLYLGGNEQSTHELVGKLLGKETLDTNTYGKSTGRSGNYSTNYQTTGRELMTPDEVRMLNNDYALLFMRGERPVMDKKYDIMRHPNVKLTPDKGGERFVHGEVTTSLATIEIAWDVDPKSLPEAEMESDVEMSLYTKEELEQIFNI